MSDEQQTKVFLAGFVKGDPLYKEYVKDGKDKCLCSLKIEAMQVRTDALDAKDAPAVGDIIECLAFGWSVDYAAALQPKDKVLVIGNCKWEEVNLRSGGRIRGWRVFISGIMLSNTAGASAPQTPAKAAQSAAKPQGGPPRRDAAKTQETARQAQQGPPRRQSRADDAAEDMEAQRKSELEAQAREEALRRQEEADAEAADGGYFESDGEDIPF